MVCGMLYVAFEFTGLSVINFYSTDILLGGTGSGSDNNTESQILDARLINLGVGFVRLTTALTATSLLDKYGKRKMYLTGDAILIVATGLLATGLQFGIVDLSRIMVLMYALGTSLSFALINPIYVSECIPYKGVCIVYILDALCSTLCVQYFPTLAGKNGIGLPASIGILFCFSVWAWIMCYKFVIETKGLTMYEIYKTYTSKQGKLLQEEVSDGGSVQNLYN